MNSRARRDGQAAIAVASCLLALAGCAPTLDWRDIRPEGGDGVQALFPCRPGTQRRELPLSGARVVLSLLSCDAGGQTWALAHADMTDPARVGQALSALLAAAAANIGAPDSAPLPLHVAGATPNPASVHLRLQGHRPDGRTVQMHLAVFTHGTRVFQATVLGEHVADGTADAFVSSLRFSP